MRILSNSVAITAALAMAAAPIAAQASTPKELRDLVGARGSSGESQLQSRGYVYKSGGPSGNGINTYYWNSSSKTCVKVHTADGRYETIDSVGSSDCGEKSGGNDTAAIAVGAAAAVGIAALLASSGKDKDKVKNYQRGYDDGYYNRRFGSTGSGSEYSRGFSDGVNANRNNSYGHGHDYYGNPNYAYGYTDLIGQSNDYVDRELRNRGYQYKGKDDLNSGHERQYWQPRFKQCLAVRTSSGRAEAINQVNKRNCN